MRSPFEIFRKHQKMLTVVLTGLAMFAFVILGAVPNPSAMPPALTAIFLAGIFGGIAWVAGIRAKKSNEWGLIGVIVGLIVGIGASLAVQPGDAVRADTGDIDRRELSALFRQRSIANQFVRLAHQRAQENGAQMFQQPPVFRYDFDENRDIVAGELLRREADGLGLEVTDESVNDFIRSLSEGKLGASDVGEIRDLMQISETELYTVLKSELKAREAWGFLYGGGIQLPPEPYWDFYRQMNVQQSAGIVPIPVDAFVEDSVEPPENELQELFAAHKANFPNLTKEGRLDEGAPGFRQPRKAALEYVEIPYEAVEQTIGEITEEEIEAHYEEYYKTAPALDMPPGGPSTDPPILPELNSEEETGDADAPASEEDAQQPGDKAAPETPGAPQETPEASTEAEPEDKDTRDSGKPATEGEPAVESEGSADSPGDGEASLRSRAQLQLVSFLDETQAPAEEFETPAQNDDPAGKAPESPQDNAPAAEKPAQENADDDVKPADPESSGNSDQKPQDKPDGDAPADGDTDATRTDADTEDMQKDNAAATDGESPTEGNASTTDADPLKPRELDDDLREEIRDQILRRKTADRQEELMNQVYEFMALELALEAIPLDGEVNDALRNETSQKLQEFAEKNDLSYERTPLLSQLALSESEEFPIGRAASATNFQSPATVAQMAFSAGPTSLYRAERVFDIESSSRFVFWKIDDVEAFEPESLEAPGIRKQVVDTWRKLQARRKAHARAEELAQQADGVDKPLSEIFAETTITGTEDGQQVSVIHPPKFSWLSRASAQMAAQMFNRAAPTLTQLRTVPGRVAISFMETVVNGLQEGEVGVTHSIDKDYYYVVRIDDRTYGTSEDLQTFRERFTGEPLFQPPSPFYVSDYWRLADSELRQYQTSWADELFAKHQVDLSGLNRDEGDSASLE